MLSQELEFCLNDAFAGAREARHEFMTVEHLLLAIVDTPKVREILNSCGADTAKLKNELKQFIEQTTPRLPAGEDRTCSRRSASSGCCSARYFTCSRAARRKSPSPMCWSRSSAKNRSHAAYLLSMQDVSRLDVVNFIAHGLSKAGGEERSEREDGGSSADAEREGDGSGNAFEKYTTNLNESAQQGQDRSAHRPQARGRAHHPDPLPPAQEQSSARRRGRRRQDRDRRGARAHDRREQGARRAARCDDLLARHGLAGRRHQVPRRFRAAPEGGARELKKQPGAILFIDEIHTVIGAGAASGGMMDASNLIKPALSNGELSCIGATTYNEYRGIFEKDHALSRRFQKIDVTEPSVQETVEILRGLKSRFEEHHGIKYADDALNAAAELSARHINDRHMPDKAIDVIDEAGAHLRLQPVEKREQSVTVTQIEDIVARIARIPPKNVSMSDRDVLKNLERNLKMSMFGQDQAIEALAAAIKMARSGLGDQRKPIGIFLFSGPTGVGKTEVTRQLAFAWAWSWSASTCRSTWSGTRCRA